MPFWDFNVLELASVLKTTANDLRRKENNKSNGHSKMLMRVEVKWVGSAKSTIRAVDRNSL